MCLALDTQCATQVASVKVRSVAIGTLFDAHMPNGAIETSTDIEYIRDVCARAGCLVVELTAA